MTPPLPTTPATVTDEELKRLLGSAPKRFAFLLRPGPEYGPQTAALQVEHVRNMFGLLRAGVLLSVTALLDGVDVLGVGVMDAASPAEVERVLAEDPAVKGGRARYEIRLAASFAQDDLRAR